MIVVRLIGGLGNQLFQYAAAKALAVQNNTNVLLDVTSFHQTGLRAFDLQHFNIDSGIASDNDISRLAAVNVYQRVWERLKPYPAKRFYKETFFHYDRSFLKLRAPLYMKGYFQSEKYFEEIEQIIREQFTLKMTFPDAVTELASLLPQQNSVAIHVRRGDYNNAEGNRFHGVLQNEYYKKALAELKTRVENPVFYLFSDNPQQAKEVLQIDGIKTVSASITTNHFEDLFLMSRCRHLIIANSSFSWWSAWLNNYPSKTVIAPSAWFNGGPKDTQDLFPPGWLIV